MDSYLSKGCYYVSECNLLKWKSSSALQFLNSGRNLLSNLPRICVRNILDSTEEFYSDLARHESNRAVMGGGILAWKAGTYL